MQSSQIPTGFHVSRRTQDTARYKDYFKYEAIMRLALLATAIGFVLGSLFGFVAGYFR